MKKTMLTIVLGLFIVSGVVAQEPGDTLWTRIYGGTDYDIGNSVQETTDGGYITVGYTRSFGAGNSDVWLIKTNVQGDTLWTKTYGGTDQDYGNSVQQTTDGGYIIAGTTYSFGAGAADVYLIKTNAQGDILWTNTFGEASWDEGWSVQETTDGGYIIAGLTNLEYSSAVYLIKTNAQGNALWTKIYGGTGPGSGCEWGRSVQQTTDGGYIITGFTESLGAGAADVYLIKTNSQGDILWTTTYGGTNDESGYSVQETTDGGYIIAGRTRSFGTGNYDVYLIRTDANGGTLWTRTFGGTDNDEGLSVQETTDGGYILTGYTGSFGAGSSDFWLIKTNVQGDTLWTRTYGGPNDDRSLSVQQTTDGSYIVVGYTCSFGAGLSDVWLLRISGEGTQLNPPQNLFVTEDGYATWDPPAGGGPQTIQVDPQSVPYWTGTTNGETFTDDSEVRAWDTEDGWMMFDVSGIPDGSTITNIEFNGYVNDNNYPYWEINGVYIDPLTATPWELFVAIINSANQYNYFPEPSTIPIGWKIANLGGTSNTDLAAALANDWFCLGINSVDNYISFYIVFDGWNEANPPFLMVDYETDDGIIAKTRVDLKLKASENRDLFGYNLYLDGGFVEYTTDLFYQYTGLTNGQTYLAGVSALYDEGESDIVEFEFTYTGVGTDEDDNIIFITELSGNYPNPFNSETSIYFSLKDAGKVTLEVYNIKGQKVKTLVDSNQPAGRFSINWDGIDGTGKKVTDGIYLYQLKTKNFVQTRKMLL
ncbi:MAG: T9SS type A sorting domain-containing protein, partial [Candidatus Cloacimonetes bacterium]|nr:T9SS type A sorting domain-containing protein [Candidatus Cloacimonadota bacterium]